MAVAATRGFSKVHPAVCAGVSGDLDALAPSAKDSTERRARGGRPTCLRGKAFAANDGEGDGIRYSAQGGLPVELASLPLFVAEAPSEVARRLPRTAKYSPLLGIAGGKARPIALARFGFCVYPYIVPMVTQMVGASSTGCAARTHGLVGRGPRGADDCCQASGSGMSLRRHRT